MSIFLIWSLGFNVHADFNHHLNKYCVNSAKLLSAAPYVNEDVKTAQDYLNSQSQSQSQKSSPLEVVIVHPDDPIPYNYHTNRLRIFVNEQNLITSAECG